MKDRLVTLAWIAGIVALVGFVGWRDFRLLHGDQMAVEATVVGHFVDDGPRHVVGAVYRFATPDGQFHMVHGSVATAFAPPAVGSIKTIRVMSGQPEKVDDGGWLGLLLMNGLALAGLMILFVSARSDRRSKTA